MKGNQLISLVYAAFLGMFLVFFVAVGISTFYNHDEEYPEYPEELAYDQDGELDSEQKALQKQYDEESEAYYERQEDYGRNVAIIAMLLAVAMLGIGVVYSEKLAVISEGFLFGGVFTLFYSMARGLSDGDSVTSFVIMSGALAIALGFGYWKFVQPKQAKPKK